MHICGDEIMAISAMLPFVGVAIAWVRSKLRMS
jgi:hypothetical protein